jgi:hypothetical protein
VQRPLAHELEDKKLAATSLIAIAIAISVHSSLPFVPTSFPEFYREYLPSNNKKETYKNVLVALHDDGVIPKSRSALA